MVILDHCSQLASKKLRQKNKDKMHKIYIKSTDAFVCMQMEAET